MHYTKSYGAEIKANDITNRVHPTNESLAYHKLSTVFATYTMLGHIGFLGATLLRELTPCLLKCSLRFNLIDALIKSNTVLMN